MHHSTDCDGVRAALDTATRLGDEYFAVREIEHHAGAVLIEAVEDKVFHLEAGQDLCRIHKE